MSRVDLRLAAGICFWGTKLGFVVLCSEDHQTLKNLFELTIIKHRFNHINRI